MWRMLQQHEPGDYVIASGKTHTIRELLDAAFAAIDIDDWEPYVHTDERFLRPAEVDLLVGNASKAREVLQWEPKVDFRTLVTMMVEHDLRLEKSRSGNR
jgi:GDPmannose 4,6-dehydratase